ncbi:hypothetical protein HHK36_001316 [Tetracentron sinense]|uniref:Importin N-terminal domain-containing protein n=1 Tax=Tetracentron sinense TaxID=13715 RepID=A0A834ZVU7_TETSI|nr:hypothetical protein HHK36_001316 [Tetracentron sinense]
MEWSPETLQYLSQCFLQTLSPIPKPRHHAEANLSEASDRPNFGFAVLCLVAEPCIDEQIHQAAAVNLQNHLRSRWVPTPPSDSNIALTAIPDLELGCPSYAFIWPPNPKPAYFAAPLLEIFLRTAARIDLAAGSGVNAMMLRYLAFEDGGGDGLAVVDELRADGGGDSLYMEKNEEEFQRYLNDFSIAVLSLLVTASASSSPNRLTITAIKFLTTLRDEDEELFELNFVEFIRRDIEGSDLDTRRRIACELMKGIATNYKEQVTSIVTGQIQNILASFTANSVVNWKEKDCAIYLVVSLQPRRLGISKPVAAALMPDVVRFIGSESNVVHSYAARLIEKLLMVKDELGVMGVVDISRDVAGPCITGLTSVLSEVCKNPMNPVFNHYMFEMVAVLVRRACEKDPSLISAFEETLFPIFQTILGNYVTEFFPYALQLLAQLVELNIPPIPPNYEQVFKLLFLAESWSRPANVLVLASSTDEQGFYVLNTVIENLGFGIIASYMGEIWTSPITRLDKSRTVKFVKPLLIYVSLSGSIELKLTSVASTRLLCECPFLLDAMAANLWGGGGGGGILDSIVTLLSLSEQDRVEEELEVPDIGGDWDILPPLSSFRTLGRKKKILFRK